MTAVTPPTLRSRLLLLPLLLGVPSAESWFVPADLPAMMTVAACPATRRPPPNTPPAAPAPREPRSPSCAQCRAPLLNAPLV